MAELATIARPYAEALFASLGSADAAWLDAIAFVAAQSDMQQYAANPKTQPADVLSVLAQAASTVAIRRDRPSSAKTAPWLATRLSCSTARSARNSPGPA